MGDGVSCPCPGSSLPAHIEDKQYHSHRGSWLEPPAGSCSWHSIFAHRWVALDVILFLLLANLKQLL